MSKLKRRLTDKEIEWVRETMQNAPQHRKPTISQFARTLGVNKPSVIKSLGGWDGIQRNRPHPPAKPEIIKVNEPVIKIEGYTSRIEKV